MSSEFGNKKMEIIIICLFAARRSLKYFLSTSTKKIRGTIIEITIFYQDPLHFPIDYSHLLKKKHRKIYSDFHIYKLTAFFISFPFYAPPAKYDHGQLVIRIE